MNRSNTKTRIVLITAACLVAILHSPAPGEQPKPAPASQPTTQPTTQPATQPAKINITIAKDTTYILGPLNKDGTVNYVAYLNAKYSKGVTPANNAATLLLTAIGPNLFDRSVRAAALRRAGMAALPLKGAYFVPLKTYAKSLTSEDMPEMPVLGPGQAERVREITDEIRRLHQTGRSIPQALQD